MYSGAMFDDLPAQKMKIDYLEFCRNIKLSGESIYD